MKLNIASNNTSMSFVPSGTGAARSSKSRLIAFLLCLFLGPAGIHRFYVGKVGTGLLWLFTGGLFSVGWIFDLSQLVLGLFRKKDGNRV